MNGLGVENIDTDDLQQLQRCEYAILSSNLLPGCLMDAMC